MKKSVILFVFVFIGLTACEKADISRIANSASTDQQSKEMIKPGQLFKIGDYTVWLDPELVDGGIDTENIYFEDPTMAGRIEIINGCSVIACPDSGSNCGRVYTVGVDGVEFIGYYLC